MPWFSAHAPSCRVRPLFPLLCFSLYVLKLISHSIVSYTFPNQQVFLLIVAKSNPSCLRSEQKPRSQGSGPAERGQAVAGEGSGGGMEPAGSL